MDHKEIGRVIKPYTGEGDVMAWLSKVELVASLSDIKKDMLVKLVPMYLEGGALAVYLEMAEDDRKDFGKLRKGLLKAFSDSPFTAFSKLKTLRWTGEPVDLYVTELRKLARESGFEGEALEHLVRMALVTGVPEKVSVDLQQVDHADSAPVSELVGRARILMAKESSAPVSAGAITSGRGSPPAPGARPVACWECGGPHPLRFCKNRRDDGRRSDRNFTGKCFKCGGPHKMQFCTEDRHRDAASCQVEVVKGLLNKVPVVEVQIDGRRGVALVDTGCSRTMVRGGSQEAKRADTSVLAVDGRKVQCLGYKNVNLRVGGATVHVSVRVIDELVGGVDVILGMDVIDKLGGVTVIQDRVKFGETDVGASGAVQERDPDISDKDFDAWFTGKHWTVRYKWNELGEPKLATRIGQYKTKLDAKKEQEAEEEVHRWIREGVLIPWAGQEAGVLPLMFVDQATKGKVRPVLDFRELNQNVLCHTGADAIDVCGDKMREWRRVPGETEMVDLKAAYLQIHVCEDLWQHQLVRFQGRMYCLTRLGFGLNVAPKIMSAILKHVLHKDDLVKAGTSSYVDDIYVAADTVSGQAVVEHLRLHGLIAKDPEKLDGGSALGLRVKLEDDGRMSFRRANEIPDVGDRMTKRELFSLCGKLVGHYPIAGWLRPVCSFVKRHADGDQWDDYIGDEARERMREVVREVQKADPVRGYWRVPRTEKGTVWTDASDLATGVVLEIGGVTAEDGTWLRKADDYNHINVAELEAVMKGINLCVHWGLKDIQVVTDSATVHGWLQLTLSGERRVRTKGAAEILIKRRLGVFKSLCEEMNLAVTVRLVKSGDNKADALTRVWKKWLVKTEADVAVMSVEEMKRMHDHHHMGVERSWFLARKVDPAVPKTTVKKVVRQCEPCQSINPAPKQHAPGELGVDEEWKRAAIDVVHYRNEPYLSLVDCGPGRFAIWRKMRGETATEICDELENIFYERGALSEVLMDNAPNFKSAEMASLLKEWNVRPVFRAAWRATGNGIVERHHRTVKSMAEKMAASPIEAVYWYNISPKDGQKEESVPHVSVYKYAWRMKGYPSNAEAGSQDNIQCEVQVGDDVWVKPGHAKCTTKWQRGTVTHVNSANNIDVDGMARHILDVRRTDLPNEQDPEVPEGEEGGTEEEQVTRRYPQRERNQPTWLRYDSM